MNGTGMSPHPEEWGVTPEEARELLERQMCPVCGEGPWLSPLNHVSRKHGIGRLVMRDICLLSTREKVTDPDVREAWIENGNAKRAILVRNSEARRGTKQGALRETHALREARAHNPLAAWIEANPDDVATLRAGFRERMTAPEVLPRWREANARSNRERVVTDEQRAAFRERMADPEVEAKRAAYYAERRVEQCSVEGCTREHVAKGLCKMHWARSRTSGKVGRPRVLSEEQMAEVRARCASGLSQRAVADQYGVTQSVVSRVVRGAYIDGHSGGAA